MRDTTREELEPALLCLRSRERHFEHRLRGGESDLVAIVDLRELPRGRGAREVDVARHACAAGGDGERTVAFHMRERAVGDEVEDRVVGVSRRCHEERRKEDGRDDEGRSHGRAL